MPIDLETLETQGKDVSVRTNNPTQEMVRKHLNLKANKGQAFTQAEVAEAVGIKPQQAHQVLNALVKKGEVRRAAVPVDTPKGPQDRIHYALVA